MLHTPGAARFVQALSQRYSILYSSGFFLINIGVMLKMVRSKGWLTTARACGQKVVGGKVGGSW